MAECKGARGPTALCASATVRQLCVRFAVKQLHEAMAFQRRVQRQFERRHWRQQRVQGKQLDWIRADAAASSALSDAHPADERRYFRHCVL